jgi:hypothetical protein
VRRVLGLSVLVLLVVAAVGRADTPAVEQFLARHWRAPIAPQGAPPARYSEAEASLAPEACGACHPAQLADWRTSLHARAMSPGVSGQLVEMLASAPGDALGCYTCHAPLAEQRSLLGAKDKHAKNPAYDAALASHGLVCAACHVRAHERFGPPRRDGSLTSTAPRETLPHNGVTRTPAFLASEFCRGCHQFEPDGLAINGKLLENTYEEWKASRFAREGVQCQDCHMPDRRHLWRGIHDAEMVRSGLEISVRRGSARTATLTVRNTRVGHAFPTYVVPRVVLRGALVDARGDVVKGSVREVVIARDVTLDLSRELRDTRLAPGAEARLRYSARVEQAGVQMRLSVEVQPDAFYTRFFDAVLSNGAGRGESQIRDALAAARRSPYTLFVEEIPVR